MGLLWILARLAPKKKWGEGSWVDLVLEHLLCYVFMISVTQCNHRQSTKEQDDTEVPALAKGTRGQDLS
jgi:hypothetical protein